MPKLLFVTTIPFFPDTAGGSEQSTLYLLRSLQELGWEVEVLCALWFGSPSFRRVCWRILLGLQKPSLTVMDQRLGYSCWRQISRFSQEANWIKALDRRLCEFQPDVVLSHSPPPNYLLDYAAQQGYSCFYFVRWLSKLEAYTQIPDGTHIIANSPFTASAIAQAVSKEIGVVLPFIDLNRYHASQRKRQYITFINPLPDKGLAIAIEVARRLPEEQFLFVKGRWAKKHSNQEIKAWMSPAYQLPNVKIWDYQPDMRQVYAVTDLLLVPSQFDETFGRVIVEAQVNGIPVIAAHVGGIPYTIGQGGILIQPKDNPQGYVDALKRLRTDEQLYRKLSSLAQQNSQRVEFDPHYQVKNFIHFVENCTKIKS